MKNCKMYRKRIHSVFTALIYLLIFSLVIVLVQPVNVAAQSGKNPDANPDANLDTNLDALLRRYASKRDLSDWEAIVLGINGVKIKTPLFATPYFKRLDKDVSEKKGVYRLVTDYARIAIVYRSHGKNARDIASYDFIDKIIHFPNRSNQGLNAYSWSLIALHGQDAAVTQPLIEAMLAYQTLSGGFSTAPLSEEKPKSEVKTDIDLTAMAITALAPYMDDKNIRDAVDRAVAFLSAAQEPDGMFKANGVDNAESVAQVIIALSACGVPPDDARFVKRNRSLLDVLDLFRDKDGMYTHVLSGKTDVIATRQAALALSAYRQATYYQAACEQMMRDPSPSEAERTDNAVRRGIFEL